MLEIYMPILLPMIKNAIQEGGIIVNALDITIKFKDGSEKQVTKECLKQELKEIINEQFVNAYIL